MRTENLRIKYLTLLALVAGGAFALLSATQIWFSVRLTDTANHHGVVTVAGSDAAPALTALSFAGLALTAALAPAGPAFRIVLSLLGILLGGSIVFSSLSALGDPVRAVGPAITSATGIAGEVSVRGLVDGLGALFWPWLAVAGGLIIALASATAIVSLRAWPGPSRKYQTRFAGEDGRPAEDVLAEEAARAQAAAGPAPGAEAALPAEPAPLDRGTAIDSWDELSRGDDPTR
ncbi:hypothetical protein ATY41_02200 [Leifsonia xyli subsp. xyli]|uniref:Trp biosynthesis-associated membrane protein n=2 Tax=Leifsonia xyli subsp. xyli TaxID=59736 RepID=Q6AF70_LEIXX|nr:Trp biosynthesis-associated membrane protein [Leifsonia xyli]AAT88975.1 conserved hypothetical protein [Leifsonia xyli subsp. xyli str. CTCB07]ODA90459.1 hypothetical protein ATY41_02200 [Leifsonia xyli subsp. xyli]